MKPIDIHTHVFNLRYLPVSGIIRRYSNSKIPKWAAKGVARFLINHTASSFTDENLNPVSPIMKLPIAGLTGSKQHPFVFQQEVLPFTASLVDIDAEDLITGLGQQMSPADLLDEDIQRALLKFTDAENKMQQTLHVAYGLNQQLPLTLDREELLSFSQIEMTRLLEWVFRAMESFENHLRWFIFMMNSEEQIFEALMQGDGKGVDMFLHLMMDIDHYFTDEDGENHQSYYDFVRQQIPNMRKLQIKYPALVGFVAVDPSRSNWKEILTSALDSGFSGVKFYPPMGYYFGMKEDSKMANRIDALLAYCEENDLPLFTHCNNSGFQAFPKLHSGYKSNPKYWARALKKYPKLRLCLGHAGGGSGWFCKFTKEDIYDVDKIDVDMVRDGSEEQENWNHSYAAQVFRLCALYSNVYCDASYLDEMVESNGDLSVEVSENFKKRLVELFAKHPDFAKKIMYGSDWHMLFREGKENVYYKSYLEFMNQPELQPFMEGFFEENARKFLNYNKEKME